jgi:putative transposase
MTPIRANWGVRFAAPITLDGGFCVRPVQRAMAEHGVPETPITDQGSQITSAEYTQPLIADDLKLSMHAKGHALDNVFVERLWRTVTYEEVCPKSYSS